MLGGLNNEKSKRQEASKNNVTFDGNEGPKAAEGALSKVVGKITSLKNSGETNTHTFAFFAIQFFSFCWVTECRNQIFYSNQIHIKIIMKS